MIVEKRVPRLAGAGQERRNSSATVSKRIARGKNSISLLTQADRMIRASGLLREYFPLDNLEDRHPAHIPILEGAVRIAILSVELAYFPRPQLARRLHVLIRELKKNFNRLEFDLRRTREIT
jgi:hypothetical protein